MKGRLVVATAALTLLSGAATAADWVMDPARSKLVFRAVAENAEFEGVFLRFDSEARDDGGVPAIEATVDVSSVDTANGQRDELLVGPEWFHGERWPRARFVTRRVTPRPAAGPGAWRAEAELRLRDVTRPVIMDLRWQPAADGTVRLEGTVRLKRLDFGIGQGDWRDTRYIADGVTVLVDVRYVPAAKAAAGSRTTSGEER